MRPQLGQRVERHLAAIFAADIAGYSRLVGLDELGTLQRLAAAREIMDALIEEYGGRIANTAGDSVLAEFPSAVDAVQCAVTFQGRLKETGGEIAPDRRVQFRIGIHVGDVVARGGIYSETASMSAHASRRSPSPGPSALRRRSRAGPQGAPIPL